MKFIPVDTWLFVYLLTSAGSSSVTSFGPMTRPVCEESKAAIEKRVEEMPSGITKYKPNNLLVLCLPPG